MRRILFVFAILQAITAIAAATTAPEPVTSKPAEMDLVHQLEALAAGKPVPIAAVAGSAEVRQKKPAPDFADSPLLDALGVIGEEFSTPLPSDLPDIFKADAERRRTVFQPYAFRSAAGNIWTIARDRRMVDPPPTEGADTVSSMPDFELSKVFFHSLNATQMERATKTGLRWADLNDVQKRMFKLALARPYGVYKTEPTLDDAPKRKYITTSATPLEVERCTLRLYIGFDSLTAPTGPVPPPSREGPEEPPMPGMPPMPGDSPSPVGGFQIEDYDLFPNDLAIRLVRRETSFMPTPIAVYDPKMKPSDLPLDASALSAPIGVNGVMPLEKAIAAVATASKMPLVVDKRLGCLDAFVGDSRMRSGDALRLLTYSFDGAWRKVGSKYLLTWDRQGTVTAILLDSEKSDLTINRIKSWDAIEKEVATPDWERIADKTLGPPPGLPIGPTAEQWKALTTVDPAADSDSLPAILAGNNRLFDFGRLDAAQQDQLREAFADRTTLPSSEAPNAPLPVDALEKSSLSTPRLMAYLDIPAVGTVNITQATVARYALNPTMQAMEEVSRHAMKKADAEFKKAATAPFKLAFATRAVAPPPLTASDWQRLFAQMNRKGLDTVYVPVFWDGQTLFPSKQFPLLPICRGEDLLAKLLAMAKPRKIGVIAVLNVLAWRLPGSEAHYLTRRSELLDVDAAGRTRREWGKQHPPTIDSVVGVGDAWDPLSVSDFVQPSVPEVRSRLLGLVKELRRYKGLEGVALNRWTRFDGAGNGDSENSIAVAGTPLLGYTLAERSAFLTEKGVDPIDATSVSIYSDDKGCDPTDYGAAWSERGYQADADLAKALLAEVEAGWPGRKQVFASSGLSRDFELPDAKVVISMDGDAPEGKAAYLQIAPPSIVPPEANIEDGDVQINTADLTPEQARHKRIDYLHAMLGGVDPLRDVSLLEPGKPGLPAAKGIVLDFTGSPDLLWDGLALLPNK